MIGAGRRQRREAPSAAATPLPWALAGVALGGLIGLPLFAPASWLAGAVASATGERVLLADARGTVWRGSALPVLTGGPGSRDASALADRLHWRIGVDLGWREGPALLLRAKQDCCVSDALALRVRPGIDRVSATLTAAGGRVGQWPSIWLAGLGTPWNTLQPGGTVRVDSTSLTVSRTGGRMQVAGAASVEFIRLSSPLSTLPVLGSYRLQLVGGAGPPQLTLSTLKGALQLSGAGSWGAHGVRFRGEARADAGDEAVLSNLLNIIGRRDQARSVISIG